MNLEDTNFFKNVPPPAGKRGPKRGTSGRKSKIFTEDVLSELMGDPEVWYPIKEGATVNENSNAIAWTRRHPEFKTVCRKMPDNPVEAPLTIYAVYKPNKEEK